MSAVFVDTVGLIATWDQDDQWHAPATATLEKLIRAAADLLTTTFVLAECGNAVARQPHRIAVERIRNDFEIGNRLIRPTDADWQTARDAYHRREGNSAGIVDCISFVVMRRLGLTQVFSNDEHFRAAGFETFF